MSVGTSNRGWAWEQYYGPNLGYVQEQYEEYVINPEAVDAQYRELFEQYGPPPMDSYSEPAHSAASTAAVNSSTSPIGEAQLQQAVAVSKLADHIRHFGHLAADIDPLGADSMPLLQRFEPESYGLTREQLQSLPASLVWNEPPANVRTAWDAIEQLKKCYTRTIAYDFGHVHDVNEKRWLRAQAETDSIELTIDEKKKLLKRMIQVDLFEKYMHKTFVGQKRFSIEGNDALVPMLDEIVLSFAKDGGKHILMGMAHRGRLNVLAHVLGKPYGAIFSEFHHSPNKDLYPSEGSTGINFGWTGDVKYHLGADHDFEQDQLRTTITLANNPSHLEYVNSVVEGFARAAQEERSSQGYPVQDTDRALAVLMHGDAAFPGEGIVAETLNFDKLRGFQNGGTIHFIVNNRIGFTTESSDSRSTLYASDLAKGYEIPILHVNADDPEACIAAVRMAFEYRDTFKKDFLIDLIGYRRHGHNEMDDPSSTQPLVYEKVNKHLIAHQIYAEKLKQSGVLTEADVQQMKDDVEATFQQAYEKMRERTATEYRNQSDKLPRANAPIPTDTGIAVEQLRELNEALIQHPESFTPYPKLDRILKRRAAAFVEEDKVDWALAETLAFASILAEGQPIRLSGQDVERGTFAQRHLMLHDPTNGSKYCPLHSIPQTKASFAIHNSPLTEAAVLGFEYGYNVFAPETLVIWEAQYGDFANVAQVIFDQFIAAGQAKWHQYSNLVMLLPHGYEGQGPEHSSARLERYLQLSANGNWMVANLTSAAQYFHLLRRQAAIGGTLQARPLVVMSPKSLLRNARSATPVAALTEGTFRPILEEPLLGSKPAKVQRLLLCSGKVALDLEAELENYPDQDWSWLHIIRVEQLYPFPEEEITEVIGRLKSLKEVMWVQEEPQNMGAWTFMESRLRALLPKAASLDYIGRGERSSPASGYADVHSHEQRQIVHKALKLQQA
ncbi:2-oxoglutarate dehydrogenase E1 component [Paenibacillus sp. UMB4589-SE434]|uniref:2-oxoglutarate dehydrogenase E1 component n=1 Tax=Paenibacillus sp. UMB4589-SE434 TaxID=3046314 RepID=UPI00254FA549|nr:2-oxoglutarate dehydrogenase E1 component [Paenibacillus sp. UMB4589-SE434]MDK8183574.1 2-oxoglutarate dehydrogenase E1 component [Paenibacillus sp. UMB4589-SE434]